MKVLTALNARGVDRLTIEREFPDWSDGERRAPRVEFCAERFLPAGEPAHRGDLRKRKQLAAMAWQSRGNCTPAFVPSALHVYSRRIRRICGEMPPRIFACWRLRLSSVR
jgi:hypothetical protein